MTRLHYSQNDSKRSEITLYAAKCLHTFMTSLSFCWIWHWFYARQIATPFFLKGNLAVIGLFLFLYVLFVNLYNGYAVPFSRISEMVFSQSLAAVFSDSVLFVVVLLLARHYVSVWPLFLTLCLQIIISVLWSLCVNEFYFRSHPPLRTVVIRGENVCKDFTVELKKFRKQFQLVDEISISEYIRQPIFYIEQAEAIFITDIYDSERDIIINDCIRKDVSLYLLPTVGDAVIIGAKPIYAFHRHFLGISVYNPSLTYLIVKRCMDIAISLLALTILMPLMVVVALLIRRDGGPVFYKQTRLTRGGMTFEAIKFRSMIVDAESDGVARLSTGHNDSRVTSIGRIIRRFRIDEIPQFLNVLRGEMSVVGPRPERPELAAKYEKEFPEFCFRLQAKAGLTGYAQVYGKYNTTPYEKLLMDLWYMSRPSLLKDIKIILVTVKILFMKESTDGVHMDGAEEEEKQSEKI